VGIGFDTFSKICVGGATLPRERDTPEARKYDGNTINRKSHIKIS
jgi:hypothetical protein